MSLQHHYCPSCGSLLLEPNLEQGMQYAVPIINLCASYFGVEPSALLTPSRRYSTVAARQAAMYFLFKYCTGSVIKIGKLLKRDRTTVIHGRTRCINANKTKRDIYDDLQAIEEKIQMIVNPLQKTG